MSFVFYTFYLFIYYYYYYYYYYYCSTRSMHSFSRNPKQRASKSTKLSWRGEIQGITYFEQEVTIENLNLL